MLGNMLRAPATGVLPACGLSSSLPRRRTGTVVASQVHRTGHTNPKSNPRPKTPGGSPQPNPHPNPHPNPVQPNPHPNPHPNPGHPNPNPLEAAYRKLTTDPTTFLRQQVLTPLGGGPTVGSTMNKPYQMVYKPGTTNIYRVTPANNQTDAYHFAAAYLAVDKIDKPDQLGELTVFHVSPPAHGELLLVTTQLSGCTIAWSRVGNQLLIAHLQPGTSTTAKQLQEAIKSRGKISGQPVRTFGPEDYQGSSNLGYAHVFGVWQSNAWHLYAQKPSFNNGDVVERIWTL